MYNSRLTSRLSSSIIPTGNRRYFLNMCTYRFSKFFKNANVSKKCVSTFYEIKSLKVLNTYK